MQLQRNSVSLQAKQGKMVLVKLKVKAIDLLQDQPWIPRG